MSLALLAVQATSQKQIVFGKMTKFLFKGSESHLSLPQAEANIGILSHGHIYIYILNDATLLVFEKVGKIRFSIDDRHVMVVVIVGSHE